MLPTLLFILGAYLLYALHAVWSRRRGGLAIRRNPPVRSGRLSLAAGGAGLAIVSLLCLWLFVDAPDEPQKPGGMLAAVLTEGWQAHQADYRLESLPLKVEKAPEPVEQPVYAYLHPEAPAPQIKPEKKPAAPRPLRKAQVKRLADDRHKKGWVAARAAKKPKVAGKTAAKKKKKPRPSPGGPPAAPEGPTRLGKLALGNLLQPSPLPGTPGVGR